MAGTNVNDRAVSALVCILCSGDVGSMVAFVAGSIGMESVYILVAMLDSASADAREHRRRFVEKLLI